MKKSRLNKIVALLLTFGVAQLHAQEVKRIDHGWDFLKSDLGGIWEAVRPVGVGNPESVPLWQQVDLPHCYNALDAVDPAINYYQGPSWYRKSLEIDNPYLNGHTLLHFEGAGQKTAVYIHTVKVGEHVGGYDEWTVDITDAVEKFKKTAAFKKQFKGKIPLSIRVDNSRDLEMIPSNLSDFNVYG
ncbi:MAG TPA: glycoside hydrolase family 2, partial [Sphingobacterium sp.]|nr:glycoside hydrolase family 2 [Sphingobacterium sp.]